MASLCTLRLIYIKPNRAAWFVCKEYRTLIMWRFCFIAWRIVKTNLALYLLLQMDLYACDLGLSTGLTLMYALQTHWSCILCCFVGGEIIGTNKQGPCSSLQYFLGLILADLAFVFSFLFLPLQYP
jgi:hypothetical protein